MRLIYRAKVPPVSLNFQRLTPQASASFTHDALGNLRTRTLGARTFTYSYNDRSRLDRAEDSGEGDRDLVYYSRGQIIRLSQFQS